MALSLNVLLYMKTKTFRLLEEDNNTDRSMLIKLFGKAPLPNVYCAIDPSVHAPCVFLRGLTFFRQKPVFNRKGSCGKGFTNDCNMANHMTVLTVKCLQLALS